MTEIWEWTDIKYECDNFAEMFSKKHFLMIKTQPGRLYVSLLLKVFAVAEN